MKYKFLGKPNRIFPHLKTGKVYDLNIYKEKVGFFESPIRWMLKETKPTILNLGFLNCPYSSWEIFYQNWRKV